MRQQQASPTFVGGRRLHLTAPFVAALFAVAAAGSPGADEPLSGDPAAEPLAAEWRAAASVPAAAGQAPANLLQIPPGLGSALVIGLESNRLLAFDHPADRAAPPRSFYVAIGKNGGAKSRQGDEKTPVGIYFVTSFLPAKTLPPIYGAGALPINYPNTWDRRLGRTGDGIWIHGTDKETAELAPQSTRGCLTLADPDLLSLTQIVELRRTPVIISDRLTWEPAATLEARRQVIAAAVEAWRLDWESLETDAYLAHYSTDFRSDGMSRERWIAHERRVNAAKTFIRVRLSEVAIYAYPGEADLVLVTFRQDYASNNYERKSWKQQFWRREPDGWRIVHEGGL